MRKLMLSVLYLQVAVIYTAPLLQWLPTDQIKSLQSQLLELQTMQQFYPMAQMGMNTLSQQPQPIIIILPDDQKSENQLEKREKEQLKPKTNEEDDSVVIEAEPLPTIDGRKAIIILPNGRFSLGGLISAIPFLPIEINVPDTISWIGSGISGIISGISQSFPFQRPSQNTMGNVGVKSNINMKTNNQDNSYIMKPMLMMPLSGIHPQILQVQFKK